ncbi:SDR family oxidoreductase [Cytobacillus sp. FSL W7-1323]|uniref:3-ketoacyl-ACP reductase n=1 Tax=Cytobacillus kochii TaxID=859143 RepID=A0A286R7X4_9BACI|nr:MULTISPECIES: SDR family oxidoreductase [Cytobacillus]ASV69781.1 3-ketoacyl-ACP reductase [Cytobacillus kochii]MDQ0184570.1 NAD(P)-dependent dehydrogenase (short-subunit alcohol dehydrogenase family) [Cytobacillus kochii]MEA1852212.1 SDR family oxidoreductase [Cytobacillus sp. OWB-43]MED1606741.1 SDR family oxidoreductase [Cytobacillus kochii]
MKFINKTVIVTGAGNGIGQGVALAYRREGANVVVADWDDSNFAALEAKGLDCLQINVQEEADIQRLLEQTIEKYGQVDILINNAGVSVFKPLFELTLDEWDRVINTNVRSVFLATKEAAKYMKNNETGGAVVNMASTRSMMSEVNSEAYAASKGGIVSLTHALALSLADYHITVNCISPGWIETNEKAELREVDHHQHPSRRVGTVADIAKACLYLTDPENNFVNGENITVDGGMTKKMIYEE